MSGAHKTCWQNGWILFLEPYFLQPKDAKLRRQRWVSTGTLSPKPSSKRRIFPFPRLVSVSVRFRQSGSCLRSRSPCPKFSLHPVCGNQPFTKGFAALSCNTKLLCALPLPLLSEAVEVDMLTHKQTTSAKELKYQVTIRRLRLTTHNAGKYDKADKSEGVPRNVTRHYQPLLGLELSRGRLPARRESAVSATRWQVASDSVRDPELSYINLRRPEKNSERKHGKQQGESSGVKC